MSHIIGVDIGTSGIKVGAIDEESNLGYITKQSYSLLYPKNGWVEIDLSQIWKLTENMIQETIQKVSRNGGEVNAISLSTFCNSSVHLNARGEPLSNGIIYLDRRSKIQADHIRTQIGKNRLYEVTRNRIEPGMYTVTSLIWMRENYPYIYEETFKWGNLSTYILFKLTGQYVMDWTQASYTGLFDVVHYEWSDAFCKELQIDSSLLPKVVSPFDIVGNYKGIKVIAGAADTACSSLALGLRPNQMFESVGTSNVLTVCTDNPDYLDNRFLNRCYVWKNQWLSHGAMSTPGAAVEWFYKNFLHDKESKAILEELPKESVIGANGVFFLPYMLGERSPVWNPNARGVYAGLHLNTTKADMLRAMYEGISFGLRQIYEIIEENYHLNFNRFRSIGGGSKNRVWAQIKANVLKQEIEIQEVSETGVYGSCLIAGKTIGYFDNLESPESIVKNETLYRIRPDESTYLKYDELYQKFKLLYPSLIEFFDATAE
ncbi:xylulokinase [Salirhabdus sp. Marseille-P4669]|uniref:xylulokinase n=1 Tax=Salirhabdus sp. Marseille-P4669 TaxID=2042310 RepID=UPI000C7C4A22|nr:FGGY family carbohydrate kinase [Salirhabdus sp. Marseille-P4669]